MKCLLQDEALVHLDVVSQVGANFSTMPSPFCGSELALGSNLLAMLASRLDSLLKRGVMASIVCKIGVNW